MRRVLGIVVYVFFFLRLMRLEYLNVSEKDAVEMEKKVEEIGKREDR